MKSTDEIHHLIHEIAINESQRDFRELYTYYFNTLMRFSMIYVPNQYDAEEIVSDAFLAVWNNRVNLLKIANFNTYIYSVVRNKSISLYRSIHMQCVNIDDVPVDLFSHTQFTPEDEIISNERILKINSAINCLPNKCKQAFMLVKDEQLNHKDAADVLQISVKTLQAHLTTAVKKIRENLKSELT